MKQTRINQSIALLAALSLLASCRFPGGSALVSPAERLGQGAAVTKPLPARPLSGRVSFASDRLSQAGMNDVLAGATVSLINTGTNQTVTTSVTDGSGNFTLSFSGGFVPDTNLTYYLEAYKGLNGNKPTNAAVRVRTLVRYTTGWVSVSSATPDDPVTVNPATTALAIGAALRHGNPSAFDFTSLIGSLNVPGGNAYAPVTGISTGDFTSVLSLVEQALVKNQDPMASIGLNGASWISVATTSISAPTVTGLIPPSGVVGTGVTIWGTDFSPTLVSNRFKFNNAQAVLSSGTTTSLQGTVPHGATSGQTTLQVGAVTVLGPLFTVPPVLTGMNPSTGTPGTSITLTGTGFDGTTPTNNVVTFNGVPATVTAINSLTSMTVAVPAGASTGKIAVTVAGVSAESSASFAVPVNVTGVTPNQAAPGTAVAITGSGFSSTTTENAVTLGGAAATVITATPNCLIVTAPTVVAPGPAVVTVGTQTGTSGVTFSNTAGGGPVAGLRVDTLAGTYGAATQSAAVYPLVNIYGVDVDSAGNVYMVAAEPLVNGTYYDTRRGGNNNYQFWVAGRITNGVYQRIAGGRAYSPYDPNLILPYDGYLDGNGFRGDNIPALRGNLYTPTQIVSDAAGNIYIADSEQHRVRKVSPAGIITTIAGNGTGGFSGDNGPAVAAMLNTPHGVAVDAAGNVYIADLHNHRIRKVDQATGKITTVAGSASPGSTGDNGPATSAQLYYPRAIALDATGSLYIAETENHRVRKVDKATGTITTLAGIAGNAGSNGDGGLATSAKLYNPYGVAVDGAGNVFIADYSTHRIRKIDKATGNISTVAGVLNQAGSNGDGGPATSAQLNSPRGVAVDGAGNLYIADYGNHRLRKVDAGGTITSLTGPMVNSSYPDYYRGDGGQAINAGISPASGVAVDGAGNTYIADTKNHVIRKVAPSGVITTFAGDGTSGFQGEGAPASSARFKDPHGLAVDAAGNLYIADYNNHRVRKVDIASGVITTIAGNGTPGFSGDGGAALSAQLYNPTGVAVDSNTGDVYVADYNNHRVRQIQASTGKIYTIAGSSAGYGGDNALATSGSLYYPTGVAFQAPNIVYVADYYNHRVRKVVIGGDITTLVGTTVYAGNSSGQDYITPLVDNCIGTRATLFHPWGVAVDPSGNVYIADSKHNRIRKVDTSGYVTTLAGSGTPGFAGDGGDALSAGFKNPKGIAIAPNGDIVVADTDNCRIRRIHPQ